ncbi:hypothetical protein AEAC466_05845 [Asticcacaulis sp. AC466]|uniref:FIST signal transduction protein n=1 Tax=Asticcacaulis sp. AC466 TaxID=1282362 RepID=UPI0003C406D1|nr:FIST N-terminal domain-containing protein [Asticcacaulis sp. AC466]ESQ85232.1 hypothetical protein AEAC466_05845 [Asticcacaulis sp. AC466]
MWTQKLDLTTDASHLLVDRQLSRSPDLVLIFGQTDNLSAQAASRTLKMAYPNAHIMGCSTGTTIVGNQLCDDGMVAMAVGFDHTRLRSTSVRLDDAEDCKAAGRELGKILADGDLRAIFLLSNGLNINGSAVVHGLTEVVGPRVRISGGLAGDGARFAQTLVLDDGVPSGGAVTALGFYGGALRLGYGTAGGWDVFGPRRQITRSEGTVLYELDGKPALDLYETYLGDEAADLPASGLFYPLEISDPARPDEKLVRTTLAVDREARSLTFAGDIPQGWNARLMQGELSHLVAGAEDAAAQALCDLQSGDDSIHPSLSVLISCVGRRLLMGQRTGDEVRAVARLLGKQDSQIGFYSYGEIAPYPNSIVSGLHNQTMTLTLLAEVA